jgi:dGTPase
MEHHTTSPRILSLLDRLNAREHEKLAEAATKSSMGTRRSEEKLVGYRQEFALDADRILHSRAYSRYIDKTQVFSLVSNDHITHRLLHVQLVSRIARTVGRYLGLNEDLIEAIALGHDIGHPPFGHTGEKFLSDLCLQHGLPPFQHNVQSVRFLDRLERKGKGWNLTLQVLDGILCHDGESHARLLSPTPVPSFEEFDLKLAAKSVSPNLELFPATVEGCVVRLADTVAYIGRDIEDAIILGLIRREHLPGRCSKVLGDTNGTIVYNLVTDLIENSLGAGSGATEVGFSEPVADALRELNAFNYEKIYLAPETKAQNPLIAECYKRLFFYYLDRLQRFPQAHPDEVDLMNDLEPGALEECTKEERVRDFIAGMTDDYFLKQAEKTGCTVPVKR